MRVLSCSAEGGDVAKLEHKGACDVLRGDCLLHILASVVSESGKSLHWCSSQSDSVLQDRGIDRLVGRTKFAEDADVAILEDEGARVVLRGDCLPTSSLVTGVSVAVRGSAAPGGDHFMVQVSLLQLGVDARCQETSAQADKQPGHGNIGGSAWLRDPHFMVQVSLLQLDLDLRCQRTSAQADQQSGHGRIGGCLWLGCARWIPLQVAGQQSSLAGGSLGTVQEGVRHAAGQGAAIRDTLELTRLAVSFS